VIHAEKTRGLLAYDEETTTLTRRINMDYADTIIDSARSRLRQKRWEQDRQERRFKQYERAIKKLDDQLFRASFPDNENRVADVRRIKEDRQEVLEEMDREFGLSENYRETVGE
jgi:hypothetical protein